MVVLFTLLLSWQSVYKESTDVSFYSNIVVCIDDLQIRECPLSSSLNYENATSFCLHLLLF